MEANGYKSTSLVIVFHSPLAEDAPADELDLLDEADYFEGGLSELGYDVKVMPFPSDLSELGRILSTSTPNLIVNLVETLFSDGRLVFIGPAMFEHFKVPYTGCPVDAMYITSNKVLSKSMLLAHGILTPAYMTYEELDHPDMSIPPYPFLIKSIWEHASHGLDEHKKILFYGKEEIKERFRREGSGACNFFAEQYVHGREFNISLLGDNNRAEVLPAAEICFKYPEGKPHIVGYRAKWDETSFEHLHTVRNFEFGMEDQVLLGRLGEISQFCWSLFKLRGYARVDFRVDNDGQIFVLEINANPCISPDSGFVDAATRAGYSRLQVIQRIISNLSNSA